MSQSSQQTPTDAEMKAFVREIRRIDIDMLSERRRNGFYGNLDEANPSNSSWQVRAVGRELKRRMGEREPTGATRRARIAIWVGVIAAIIALAAVPLDGKSVYCRVDPFSLCVAEEAKLPPPPPATPQPATSPNAPAAIPE